MNMKNEPVRLVALISGTLTAVGTCLVSIANGVPALAAVGTAVMALGVVIGGGEIARSKVAPVDGGA